MKSPDIQDKIFKSFLTTFLKQTLSCKPAQNASSPRFSQEHIAVHHDIGEVGASSDTFRLEFSHELGPGRKIQVATEENSCIPCVVCVLQGLVE